MYLNEALHEELKILDILQMNFLFHIPQYFETADLITDTVLLSLAERRREADSAQV